MTQSNRAELEELLNILSSAIGSLTNPTKLSSTFKTVKKKTISNAMKTMALMWRIAE